MGTNQENGSVNGRDGTTMAEDIDKITGKGKKGSSQIRYSRSRDRRNKKTTR